MNELKRLAAALSPRYQVDRLIGHGAAAHVYVADDTVCHRRVAVKVLRAELASSLSVDRFRAEIRVAAQLRHPSIVPVYATGEADNLPYYVMPFIDGETLRTRLERARRLSIGEALRVTADIARALDFAHRRRVVHRDIKPENVMLRDGRALLLDFGIALALDEAVLPRRTAPGMRIGTVEYMSPEQAAGEHTIDGRSDIYSLACVTYEMLCGQPPFSGPAATVMSCHATAEPRALVSVCPEIPHSISHVLSRALVKMPVDRIATAGELVGALRRASAGHAPPRRCVAVLSAAHTPEGAAVSAFNEQVTEHVAHALADLPGVTVAAGSTMPALPAKLHLSHIARQLEADALLFTNACETENGMRLTGTLLGSANGRALWSGTFCGRKGECVSVLSELAPQLARAVGSALIRVTEDVPGTRNGRMTASA